MRRTLVLVAVAVVGIVGALFLPRAVGPGKTAVQPPPPVVKGLPTGSLVVTARPARKALDARGDELDVVVELTAVQGSTARAPVDLALVLDRSGSMGGEPLAKAKEAARTLVKRLGTDDRLALVHFGTEATLALGARVMDDEGRRTALEAIERIVDDGGTNMSGALEAAAKALDDAGVREKAVRRIVLLSDGEANEGLEGPALTELVRRLAGRGPRVSALGLGAEFDEDQLFDLAIAGGGHYRYLSNGDEVAAAFTKELSKAAATAATNVVLSLETAPGIELVSVFGFDAAIAGGRVELPIADIAAGDVRRVVLRVKANGSDVGTRALLGARATYEDLLADRRPSMSEARAAVSVTRDASEIASSWDRDAARVGLKARFGGSMLGAAGAYEKNDLAAAEGILDGALSSMRLEAAALGDVALVEEIERTKTDAATKMKAASANSDDGRVLRKTLKNFGKQSMGFE